MQRAPPRTSGHTSGAGEHTENHPQNFADAVVAPGLACAPGFLLWTSWVPGQEYIQRLIVKNTSVENQEICHQIPMNKAVFFVPFPKVSSSSRFRTKHCGIDPVKLCVLVKCSRLGSAPQPVILLPGLSHEVEVAFRPFAEVAYEDQLAFTAISASGTSTFKVDLKAFVPFTELHLPARVDLGPVSVHETASTSAEMCNTGTLPLEFTWEVNSPFHIMPKSGSISPSATLTLEVSPPTLDKPFLLPLPTPGRILSELE
eukprot:gene12665-2316_t